MHKITTENYFDTVKKFDLKKLPEILFLSHDFIVKETNNGKDWSAFGKDAGFTRMTKLVFKKLEEFMESKNKNLHGINDEGLNGNYLTPRDVAINLIKPSVLRGDTIDLHPANKLSVKDIDYAAHIENESVVVTMLYGTKISESFLVNDLMEEIVRVFFKNKYHSDEPADKVRKKRTTFNHKQPEFKVLKAILNWHNASVSNRQVEWFINELQGYIKSKKITKNSPVANEIKLVQEKLIAVFNSMGERIKIELSPETKKIFQAALKKVTDVHKFELPDKKKGLDGIDSQSEPKTKKDEGKIMSSVDFADMHFDSIGFKDKWLDFIGDPCEGFTAMVFGMPKMGKSYLCIEFAGYLARNHGKVLYVAKEEKLDATLQKKLTDKNVAHKNLFVTDELPKDLSEYDFIFLDSVSKLGLSPKDLNKLKAGNPDKSFVYIFQATKGGQFKGNNEFQHDVDVVIEVPKQGKAVQFGRFNQGGEMNIFPDDSFNLTPAENVPMLAGIKRKHMEKHDWTEPEHLSKEDHEDLKYILKMYKEGNFKAAMSHAHYVDTIVREEIPGEIWKEMGGKLTDSGEAKLKKNRKLLSAAAKKATKK